MNINRDNYEEYFILYMDNELSDEERRQVEIFVQQNADLKSELDMLLQSKLVPDADINFDNKEMLMVKDSSISIANYEEWLLSYIDNELAEEERNDVERFVAANPIVQKEFNLLQQAKLQPEAIAFPYKKSLYRREEKAARIISIGWWRMAAAAVLLLGISTAAIVLLNKKPDTKPGSVVDVQPKNEKSTNNPDTAQPVIETAVKGQVINDQKKIETPIKENNEQIADRKKNTAPKEKNKQLVEEKKEEPVVVQNNNEKKPTNDLPQPTNENPYVKGKTDINDAIVQRPTNDSGKATGLTNNNGIAEFTNVTDKPLQPSYAIEQSDGKKNKLRGFFRKVTRTFEKRTNIKATDDDDRLLIAGLTIKLN